MTNSNSLVNYSKSALIVWDLQYGIASKTIGLDSILANVRALIYACHKRQRPVFFSQATGLPYDYQSPYIRYWLAKRGIDPKIPRMVEGSQEWSIIAEVAPSSEDFVLKKTTHSFFVGTNLEQLLRNRGIECIIITGVSTEVGIEATARHAAHIGFVPVIAEDAIGSSEKQLHEASLAVIRKLFEVKPTKEILNHIQTT